MSTGNPDGNPGGYRPARANQAPSLDGNPYSVVHRTSLPMQRLLDELGRKDEEIRRLREQNDVMSNTIRLLATNVSDLEEKLEIAKAFIAAVSTPASSSSSSSSAAAVVATPARVHAAMDVTPALVPEPARVHVAKAATPALAPEPARAPQSAIPLETSKAWPERDQLRLRAIVDKIRASPEYAVRKPANNKSLTPDEIMTIAGTINHEYDPVVRMVNKYLVALGDRKKPASRPPKAKPSGAPQPHAAAQSFDDDDDGDNTSDF